jgi:hypothetical protein
MATTNDQLSFRWSGGSGNTDPDASLGGDMSNTDIHELESTVTTAPTIGDSQIIDNTVSDADDTHVDTWIVFITGANAGFASRVISSTSTGVYTLEDEVPATGLVGDIYRRFALNSLFDDVTALESANGVTDYRGLFFRNGGPDLLTDVRFYLLFSESDPGNAEFEISVDDNANNPTQAIDTISPDTDTPDISGFGVGAAFSDPGAYEPVDQPRKNVTANMQSGLGVGIWVKRTTPANSARKTRSMVLLVVEATDALSAQVLTWIPITFGVTGFTPVIDVTPDRGPVLTPELAAMGYESQLPIGGGARYAATVTSQETGLVVPGVEVAWTHEGQGVLTPFDAPTDSLGRGFAALAAPSVEPDPVSFGLTLSSFLASASFFIGSQTISSGVSNQFLLCAFIRTTSTPANAVITFKFWGTDEFNTLFSAKVGDTYLDLLYLADPSPGANQLLLAATSTCDSIGYVLFDAHGVDNVSVFDSSSLADEDESLQTSATGGLSTDLQTTEEGSMLFDVAIQEPLSVSSLTPGADQTEIFDDNAAGVDNRIGVSYQSIVSGEQLATMSWTGFDATVDAIHALVALRPLVSAKLTADV